MNPTNEELTQGQKDEMLKREMLRQSLDRVKVLNPTSEDYTVYWDKFPHLVPANGEAVFPRYIANKYIKEVTDKILTYRSDENVKMENERRVKKGMAVMDKHTEQPAFESKFRIDQPELRKPVIVTLYGGVEEVYGKDLPLESQTQIRSTSDADLLAEIEKSNAREPLLEEESLTEEVTEDDKN